MTNINLQILKVGQMKCNCYLLSEKSSGLTAIIDPGDDSEYLKTEIADKNLKPMMIIATHGHFDHLMAVTDLVLSYNLPFFCSRKDEFLVKNLVSSTQHFLNITPDPAPQITHYLDKKTKIKLGNISFKILETPGHTPGSICLYLPKEKIIFTGDTIFGYGIVGRTDLSYSSKMDLEKSLAKILLLPQDTLLYPGHGKSSIIAKELFFHRQYGSLKNK